MDSVQIYSNSLQFSSSRKNADNFLKNPAKGGFCLKLY